MEPKRIFQFYNRECRNPRMHCYYSPWFRHDGNISKYNLTKRGVSPLIATVLLIAFAVALGAVVMNWGRGYVEDTADDAREKSDRELVCASEIDLAAVDVDSVTQICYSENGADSNISMVLECLRYDFATDLNKVEFCYGKSTILDKYSQCSRQLV